MLSVARRRCRGCRIKKCLVQLNMESRSVHGCHERLRRSCGAWRAWRRRCASAPPRTSRAPPPTRQPATRWEAASSPGTARDERGSRPPGTTSLRTCHSDTGQQPPSQGARWFSRTVSEHTLDKSPLSLLLRLGWFCRSTRQASLAQRVDGIAAGLAGLEAMQVCAEDRLEATDRLLSRAAEASRSAARAASQPMSGIGRGEGGGRTWGKQRIAPGRCLVSARI